MVQVTAEQFQTISSVGGLLPADVLRRVAHTDPGLGGLSPGDYHLAEGERLREAISRSWNRLTGAWEGFQAAAASLPDTDRGTTLTREKWLQILFQELGYGRLQTTGGIAVDDTEFPVSHAWSHTPIHLVSFRLDLDRRAPGAAGAARWSPHAMVQELVNRSPEHRWALVANGLRLRVLRDNAALTRQAYVEFDLEAMMNGEVYADFVVLWLVCHQSRVESERPEECWLEQWTQTAERDGTRALDKLREGVEHAIETLGTGFLDHPANSDLRQVLRDGDLDGQDYYRQLLRLVYRLLFLFVAEDRDLLLIPLSDAKPEARERYDRYYSTRRLRLLARRHAGGKHPDLWRALRVVIDALGSHDGAPALALPPLGGGLWDRAGTAAINGAELANGALLESIRHLAYTNRDNILRAVDYRNLGAEELGSVYEALLELQPATDHATRRFTLGPGAGSERKSTGSYYTPTSLITQLLNTALEPVLDQAVHSADPEQSILDLKVCDPATGSGHFLIAAGNRMAKRLAMVRTGDGEPSPYAIREALRQVVGRCLYGVDVNPMAVELAKVSLWLEAHVPCKPLTFLDHHIKRGNSLLGATPALIAKGVPDEAFRPMEGDERKIINSLKRTNKQRREGQGGMFIAAEAGSAYHALSAQARALGDAPDDDVDALHEKQQRHATLESEADRQRLTADAWCAAFVIEKTSRTIDTQPFEAFYKLRDGEPVDAPTMHTIEQVVDEHAFFHWHIEFPDVLTPQAQVQSDDRTGWSGGFDCLLGNPPWIAHAGRAAQPLHPGAKRLLIATNPGFTGYSTTHGGFVVQGARLLRPQGWMGLVVPTSVADLDGYGNARKEHELFARAVQPLDDFGDGAFDGVFQPCMALVSEAHTETCPQLAGAVFGDAWQLKRPELSVPERQLLDYFNSFPRFPPATFAARGLQTNHEKKQLIAEYVGPVPAGSAALREGKDIQPFVALPPRLCVPLSLLASRWEDQKRTPILVRQTARFPIAAMNDGSSFRDSLLAVTPLANITDAMMIGYLNSRLTRWLHFQRFRSARQGMPQIRLSHLRALPDPSHSEHAGLMQDLGSVSGEILSGVSGPTKEQQGQLDEIVFAIFGVPRNEQMMVLEWAEEWDRIE